MIAASYAERFCILGAGTSGLAAAKNFLEAGIPFDVLEREDEIGGNWLYGNPSSSVYRSTRLISSKRLTEYTDFPMPDDYPEFPGQQQVWLYICDYARNFGLYPHIQFKTSVQSITPDNGGWSVTLTDGSSRRYRGVVIANGHNWDPNRPELPGTFDGETMHSAEYKTPDVLKDRRVLVIGAGNSGCDIVVEAAGHAAAAFHSTRRGYHYLPKFLHGKPIDVCGERLLRWRLPLWLRRSASRSVPTGDPACHDRITNCSRRIPSSIRSYTIFLATARSSLNRMSSNCAVVASALRTAAKRKSI